MKKQLTKSNEKQLTKSNKNNKNKKTPIHYYF